MRIPPRPEVDRVRLDGRAIRRSNCSRARSRRAAGGARPGSGGAAGGTPQWFPYGAAGEAPVLHDRLAVGAQPPALAQVAVGPSAAPSGSCRRFGHAANARSTVPPIFSSKRIVPVGRSMTKFVPTPARRGGGRRSEGRAGGSRRRPRRARPTTSPSRSSSSPPSTSPRRATSAPQSGCALRAALERPVKTCRWACWLAVGVVDERPATRSAVSLDADVLAWPSRAMSRCWKTRRPPHAFDRLGAVESAPVTNAANSSGDIRLGGQRLGGHSVDTGAASIVASRIGRRASAWRAIGSGSRCRRARARRRPGCRAACQTGAPRRGRPGDVVDGGPGRSRRSRARRPAARPAAAARRRARGSPRCSSSSSGAASEVERTSTCSPGWTSRQ